MYAFLFHVFQNAICTRSPLTTLDENTVHVANMKVPLEFHSVQMPYLLSIPLIRRATVRRSVAWDGGVKKKSAYQ